MMSFTTEDIDRVPMQMIAMDIMGPFPTSVNGNKGCIQLLHKMGWNLCNPQPGSVDCSKEVDWGNLVKI